MADIFNCTFGDVVDLDDLSTYPEEWLEMSAYELFQQVWSEIGKSIVYMDFLQPSFGHAAQRKRVINFCRVFAFNSKEKRENTPENRLWWLKFRFKFLDEVENQC